MNHNNKNKNEGKSYSAYSRKSLWQIGKGKSWKWLQSFSHSQLFVSSFVLLILLGSFLFKTLPNLYVSGEMSWLDALFTSTSAICVTGLIVVDTAQYFTFWGQLLLLVLIQFGGLGMLTFASLIILAFGKKLSVKQETIYQSFASSALKIEPHKLVYKIIIFSFSIEFVGACCLYIIWLPEMGWRGALWPSIFHSVSAFCNAGFSVFSNSLEYSSSNSGILLVCSLLIICGGLGFFTLQEVSSWMNNLFKKAGNSSRLSLQSKIVLVTSLFLIIIGSFCFAFLEWNGVFADMSIRHKVLNSFFMSVSSRTAGFNSVLYSEASDATNFLNIILMMIGGSPGSTAGGVKTTTLFIVLLLAWSRLRGDSEPAFASRSLPAETVSRAVGLLVIASVIVTISVFLLCITESELSPQRPFLVLLFEAVSAFNTVGLSLGMTSDFSSSGKIILILLMFLGRVGPLGLAAAIFVRSRKCESYRYAYEDVVVG